MDKSSYYKIIMHMLRFQFYYYFFEIFSPSGKSMTHKAVTLTESTRLEIEVYSETEKSVLLPSLRQTHFLS